jgi:hypothetical protein
MFCKTHRLTNLKLTESIVELENPAAAGLLKRWIKIHNLILDLQFQDHDAQRKSLSILQPTGESKD